MGSLGYTHADSTHPALVATQPAAAQIQVTPDSLDAASIPEAPADHVPVRPGTENRSTGF